MTLARIRPSQERTAILRGGTLFFEGRTTPCIVRALSETGARLVVYSPDRIPSMFRLFIELANVEVDCRLSWRKGKEIGVEFIGAAPAMTDVPAARRALAGKRMPILVAEDDPDDRQLIASAFHESGRHYDLTFVPDGEEAIRHLGRIGEPAGPPTPQLILLDLNMPKVDGRGVLRHVKAGGPLRRIPVVVFTTSNADEDIEGTYDLGVSSYIVKPSHYEGLLEVIQMLDLYWGRQVLLPRQS